MTMICSGLLPRTTIIGGLALALITATPTAQANVFASNVKVNGSLTNNVSVAQGSSVNISYILNEPASAGVTLKILSGATLVRTVSIAAGKAGAIRGTNTVVWDGRTDSNVAVPAGNYAISITAGSTGYPGWTITTDDSNDGNYVWDARGIAVNRNTNSPYYGRIYVGNSDDHSTEVFNPLPGDYLGIQKLNADGSYADEGASSTGGVMWSGGGFAPWKVRVADDDKVYVEDWSSNGDLYRFDPLISSNSMLHVFRADNVPTNNVGIAGDLSGFAIAGTGTNTQIWMADNNSPDGTGILKYTVTADGTCATNDTGTTIAGVGGSLDNAPYDAALDKGGNIYSVQTLIDPGNPAVRVLRFEAYDPSTNGGAPELTATWAVGAGDDTYAGAHGLAVDPTGTYVAVACWGVSLTSGFVGDGSTTIFYATNGTVVTNVDLGVSIPSRLTTNSVPPLDPAQHEDTDCAWDAVGNLYYLDNAPGVWRAVSPPGANHATTFALPMVQVTSSATGQPPVITSVVVSNGVVTIRFTAGSTDSASNFSLLSAPAASGPYSPAAGAVITGSGGSFQASVPASGQIQFYQVIRSGSTPPPSSILITSLRVTNGVATVTFTGASTDSASAFTLLSSPTVGGPYSPATGAVVTGSAGSFQATVPASGQRQFYRVVKSGTNPNPSPILITNLKIAGGKATVSFTGASSDAPSAFTLLSAPAVSGTYSPAAGASVTNVASGQFQATAPTNGAVQFYRIRR